jgi:hypothetical protein
LIKVIRLSFEIYRLEGKICKAVDCVINPNTSDAIKKNNPMLLFFYQLCSNYLDQKYQIKLDESNLILTKPNFLEFKIPNMKYKGKSMELQRVKGKKAPKIQTMNAEDSKPTPEQLKQEAKAFNDISNAPGYIKNYILILIEFQANFLNGNCIS